MAWILGGATLVLGVSYWLAGWLGPILIAAIVIVAWALYDSDVGVEFPHEPVDDDLPLVPGTTLDIDGTLGGVPPELMTQYNPDRFPDITPEEEAAAIEAAERIVERLHRDRDEWEHDMFGGADLGDEPR